MKTKISLLAVGMLFATMATLQAQTDKTNSSTKTDLKVISDEKEEVRHPMNFVKFNATSLVVGAIGFQYERILSKRISLAIGYNTRSSSALPFKQSLLDQVDASDIDTRNIIENIQLGGSTITPEIRFYTGKKGYGKGFYIAPFYRNTNIDIEKFTVLYSKVGINDASITLSGNFKSNTAGLLFGAQWGLGKLVSLDWWIAGPHIGNGKGDIEGLSDQPLTAFEQNEVRKVLNDFDIPLTKKTVEVSAAGAKLALDGPWAGLRAGISIGIRF